MAMATGDLSANVNIGGDVSGLRKSLDEGRSRLNSFASDAQAALGRIDGAMSQIGSSLATLKSASDQFTTALQLIGVGGAAAGLVSAFRQVASSAKEWAAAGEQARKRGVTVEFMSELRFAAEELGTKTAVVNDAMDRFRVKIAEVKTEGSKSAESLKALSEPLYNVLRAAPDQKMALFAVADAIKSSGSASDQAKLAVELFGSAGVSMIHVLSQGEDGLKTWAKAAKDAGVVMDSGTAESAKRLTHALDLLDRSPAWQSIERKMIAFARNTAVILGGSAEAMSDNELSRAIKVTEDQLGGLEKALREGAKAGQENLGVVDQLKGSIRELVNTFSKDALGKTDILPYDPTAAVTAKIEETKQRLAQLRSLQDARAGLDRRQDAVDLQGAGGAPASAAAPNFSKSEAFLDSLRKRMLTETQQMMAAIDHERDIDLRKLDDYLAAGTIRQEDAARARFDIEAKYDAEIRKLRDKSIQPFTQAISNDLDRAFGDWIEKGEVSWSRLANAILADIAKIAMRQAILEPLFGGGTTPGTGAIGGLIGSVTSGLTNAFQLHDGNLGGSPALRMVNAADFNHAPRLHTGNLRPREFRAILEQGEGVLSRRQMKSLGEGGGVQQRPAPNVTFNIQTPDVEGFRRSEGQISAMVARVVARGQRNA